MKKVEEKAYAKVNLVLNIGDRRPDGYHDIQTVMQSLELHDDVTVEQVETALGVPVLPVPAESGFDLIDAMLGREVLCDRPALPPEDEYYRYNP